MVYTNMQSYVDINVDFHRISIRAGKDPTKKWYDLSYLATDDVIFNVLETWPSKWHAPDITEIEKLAAQRKKEEAKLRIAKLTEKRRKEVATEKA